MNTLEGQQAVVTGGNRGFGLAIVEALVAKKAKVTVVARDAGRLAAVQERLGVAIRQGDVTDPAVASAVMREVKPTILVLNAGVTPTMLPLHEQTWESFSAPWLSDTKAGFHWIQEALRLPLPRGSRVLVSCSGAAVAGSPLSGGLAGAKRMLWIMAKYANGVSAELDLGIRFQAIVPMQISGETAHGRSAAQGYAAKKGVTVEQFLAGFGKAMPPRQVGEHVVEILTNPDYDNGIAFGLKGDTGISTLEG